MTVVLRPWFPHGRELLRALFRGSLVLENRRGHGELAEAGHRMEEQCTVTVNVHGTEGYPEYPVGPLEPCTVQLVPGRQRIRIEEVMLYSERGVLEEVVYHDTVSPDVHQVRYRGAAVVVPDVHRDVDVEGILFDLLVRQGVSSNESIRAQIEDVYGGWTELFGSPGCEFRLAGVEDP